MKKARSLMKLLCLMVALAFVLTSITACGQNNQSKEEETQAANVESTSTQEAAPTEEPQDPKLDKSEYYEVELYPEIFDPKFEQYATQNSFRKALKDKFNFGFKLVANPGDPKETLTVWLASGEYPELVRLYEYKYLKAYYDAGALIDFKPIADKYAPEFVKRKGWECDAMALNSNAWGIKPDQWYFYNYAFDSTYGNARPYLEWVFRSDILEQQGYPEIRDEFSVLDILRKGLKDNPQTDGKPTIGLSLPFAAWNNSGVKIAMYLANLGKLHHFTYYNEFVYDPDTHKYTDVYKGQSLLAALKFYNTAYREGLLDKESITDDWDSYQKKMENGQVLSNFFMMWGYPDFNNKLKAAGKDYRYVPMTSMLKNQLDAGEKKMYVERTTTVAPGWSTMSITKNCKYPERLMEVLNWCMSEEGYVLAGWGEEGVNYTVVDGKRVPTQEFYNRSLNDPDFKYTYEWEFMFGFDSIYDEKGQCYNIEYDPQVIAKAQDPKIIDVYSHYGWSNFNDMYTKNKNFQSNIALKWVQLSDGGPELWSEDEKKTWEKVGKVVEESLIKAVIAKNDEEFQKVYDSMIAKRDEYGVPGFLDRLNERYTKYYEAHASEGNY